MVESKNNHFVRRYGFHYRYDTDEERAILAKLWEVVCLKLNFFTSIKKPIGWSQDASRQCKRFYDQPKTPYHRLLDAGVLSQPPTRRTRSGLGEHQSSSADPADPDPSRPSDGHGQRQNTGHDRHQRRRTTSPHSPPANRNQNQSQVTSFALTISEAQLGLRAHLDI